MKRGKWASRMAILAAMMLASVSAHAIVFDATILIDRALNSPTITVRYKGATAVMAELRLNGVSIGTRSLDGSKQNGETNFTLDLSSLNLGDNEIEVRLLNKAGKVVGTQKQLISTEDKTAPVFLKAPKMGATVQGPVEISVGFGRQMRNSFVSFFIDNQFKSMSNVPPYSFIWDTTRETNGWHEVEAWVVDDSSETLKTRKVRVFVNNPSGFTPRKFEDPPVATTGSTKADSKGSTPPAKPPVDLDPVKNPAKSTLVGNQAGLKSTGGQAQAADQKFNPTAPGISAVTIDNEINPRVGAQAGTKPASIEAASATSGRLMTPTGTRTVPDPKQMVATKIDVKLNPVPTVNAVSSAMNAVRITKGTRMPNIGNFTIMLDAEFVEFDVQPRVQDGIPLTPFRHLLEKAGGEVKWEHDSKSVFAAAEGREIWVRIGDRIAKINNLPVELELSPFIERGRTIVPLSFIQESLDVTVDYDPATGHVLITRAKK